MLSKLGFQPLSKYDRFFYPEEVFAKPEEEREEPEATPSGRPYILAALVFAVVALGALLLYGATARQSTASAERDAVTPVLWAVASHDSGDTTAARELSERARALASKGYAIAFLDGFMSVADAAEGGKTPEEPRPRSVEELVAAAGRRRASGDLDEAVQALTSACDRRRRSEVLRLIKADTMLAAGMPEQAISEADKLGELGFGVAAGDLRARAYLALGQPRRAVDELTGALAYRPDSTYLRLVLASALIQSGDHTRAARELSRVLSASPSNPVAYLTLANLLSARGRPDDALKALRKALELNSSDPVVLNNLAWLLAVDKSSPKKGLEYAKRAYEITPEFSNVVDTLGWIHHLLGHNEKALPLLRRARTLKPKLPDVDLRFASALVAGGKKGEAVEVLTGLAADKDALATVRAEARKQLEEIQPEKE